MPSAMILWGSSKLCLASRLPLTPERIHSQSTTTTRRNRRLAPMRIFMMAKRKPTTLNALVRTSHSVSILPTNTSRVVQVSLSWSIIIINTNSVEKSNFRKLSTILFGPLSVTCGATARLAVSRNPEHFTLSVSRSVGLLVA